MTQTYTQATPAEDKPVEFAVGQRQLAAIGFVCFVALGLVSTLAYVAGRVAGQPGEQAQRAAGQTPAAKAPAAQATVVAAAPVAKKPSPVEQLIMVDSVSPPAEPAPPVAPKPVPPPAVASQPAPAPPPVVVKPSGGYEPTPVEKLTGNTYLQVVATERTKAVETCDKLAQKGLPALIGDSPSDGIFRVLVGPIRNASDIGGYQALINEVGFQPFVKKY